MMHPEAGLFAGTGPYGAHSPSDVHRFDALSQGALVG